MRLEQPDQAVARPRVHTASSVDAEQHLATAIPEVMAFVVLLTLLIMGWVFRSVAIALATAAVNLLSAAAAFGLLVLTFQHTWAERLLGFHSTGPGINWIPLFTFAVLFGLSMDYHVFVLSRIREAARDGLPTREAVIVLPSLRRLLGRWTGGPAQASASGMGP